MPLVLLLATAPALASDPCFAFATPWEAMQTWNVLRQSQERAPDSGFPGEAAHALLLANESRCAIASGDTTTWDCTSEVDGVDAAGSRTTVIGDGETLTTWDGFTVGLEGDAIFASFDAYSHYRYLIPDRESLQWTEEYTENGTLTWADGSSDAWSLKRNVDSTLMYYSPADGRLRIDLDYTLGACSLNGSYGNEFDGASAYAPMVDLESGGHRLQMGPGSDACWGSYSYTSSVGNPYGFGAEFHVGLWDGAPFGSVEPGDTFPDADGDMFVAGAGDCGDAAAWVHVCARECVNGVDDDCDGRVDEADGGLSVDCPDTDQDADGHVHLEDCDDLDPTVWEGCPDTTDTAALAGSEGDSGADTDTAVARPAPNELDPSGALGCAGGHACNGVGGASLRPLAAALAALTLLRRRATPAPRH